MNIIVNKNIDGIRAIANREGWRALVCNRGGGVFQLIEVWVENTFMLEVMTPAQTARHVEITDPRFMAEAFENALKNTYPTAPGPFPAELNLIG